ncbi:hypothetical protein [Portibacter lacus]|uniref:Uncharacterized protein n=1 Tax=Portibacter lacus TaxID=1099794 RepID=A0AA37SSG0_9BACT|nr:hypothetical protein [Portibacter lacus]GLR19583.1 hypothetical protein GCM10007940_41990 [Portibacter lacus]
MKNSLYLKLLFVFVLYSSTVTFINSQGDPPPPSPPPPPQLATLKNLGLQQLGYGVFSERYDMPATEVSFTMKSDKKSHDVKLGELIRINGVWKVFTYPRFN